MKMTIIHVDLSPHRWEGPNGPVDFITVNFSDGSQGSIGAKPENVPERIETLEALVDVEGEYELETKPEYNGTTQWKIKSWPGKPSFGGGGMSAEDRATLERIETKLDAVHALLQTSAGVATGMGKLGATPASSPVSETPLGRPEAVAEAGAIAVDGGRGETEGGAQTAPSSFDDLAKRVGGRAKARELINSTVGSSYSAAAVLDATPAELEAAFEALQGVSA